MSIPAVSPIPNNRIFEFLINTQTTNIYMDGDYNLGTYRFWASEKSVEEANGLIIRFLKNAKVGLLNEERYKLLAIKLKRHGNKDIRELAINLLAKIESSEKRRDNVLFC